MATPVELLHLCLPVAAGGVAYRKWGVMLPSGVRVALYMLAAFALRRGNLGRDVLRGPSSHAHRYSAGDDRSPWLSRVRYARVARHGTGPDILKDKRGLPYPCCC